MKQPFKIDLAEGQQITQAMVDQIWLAVQRQSGESEYVDILITNVDVKRLPRLIVDYGQIYEALYKALNGKAAQVGHEP